MKDIRPSTAIFLLVVHSYTSLVVFRTESQWTNSRNRQCFKVHTHSFIHRLELDIEYIKTVPCLDNSILTVNIMYLI